MTRTEEVGAGVTTVALVVALTVGAVAFTPSAAAADAELSSGTVVWQGQTLHIDAGSQHAAETWGLRTVTGSDDVGALVGGFRLNGTGEATLGTTVLDGRYVVVDANDSTVHLRNGRPVDSESVAADSFEVTPQTIDATFDADTVTNDRSVDARTALRLSSNRVGYEVYLAADGLSAEQLAAVFENASVREGVVVLRPTPSDDETIAADFGGVEPGNYEMTVLATDSTARATATVTVAERGEGAATFDPRVVTEQRGDVANFTVVLDGTDTAEVSVGSTAVNYLATATVVDANGDGEVTVELNSFTAGQAGRSGLRAAGGDELRNATLETESLSDPLDAAEYPLAASVDGFRTGTGSLLLEERSTDGVRILTAPGGVDPASVSGLLDVASEDGTVARGDWVVVEVSASGVFGYVDSMADLTARDAAASLAVTQTNPGLNQEPRVLRLANERLLLDAANDRLFVLVDTRDLRSGDTYAATFTLPDRNQLVPAGANENASAAFTVVQRDVSFDLTDGNVTVPATTGATVGGTSTLAPGSEFTVGVENRGAAPFIQQRRAEVGADGTWNVSFDLSGVPPGTTFAVRAGDPAAEATGVVVGEVGAGTTTEADAEPGAATTAASTTEGATTTPDEMATETETPATQTEAGTTEPTTEAVPAGTTTETPAPTTTEMDQEPAAGSGQSGFGVVLVLLALWLLALYAVSRI